MGRRSKVLQLPNQVRAELDERIRRAGYGDYTAISQWLADLGHDVSKSALHRYGAARQELDASRGSDDAQLSTLMKSPPDYELPRRDELLLQLGRLRLAESRILEQLEMLDETG